MSRFYIKKWYPLAAAVLAAGLSGCGDKVEKKPEVARPAKIIEVVKGKKTGVRTYPGKAYATDSASISFRISGPLVLLPATKGQEVTKGTLLAQIDPRDFVTQLNQVKASIDQEKAKLKDAELRLGRYRRLIKDNAVSQTTLDTAISRVDALKASLKNLAAQEQAAKDALKDTEIRAPYDGTVADVFVDNLEEIRVKQPILLFQNVSKIDIKVEVPEQIAVYRTPDKKWREGTKVEVEFSAVPGRRFPLDLKEASAEANPSTNTYQVTLIMDAPEDFSLMSGMTCQVFHTSPIYADKSGIIIPSSAIFNDENSKPCVWIVKDSSRLEKRVVEVGEISSVGIVVKSGLKEGERIIESGVHFAFEKMLVKQLEEK